LGHAVTAPAGEGEGIHQDRTNLLIQMIAQELPGAMQACFDRLRPQTQEV
jgi:hypothetical protein